MKCAIRFFWDPFLDEQNKLYSQSYSEFALIKFVFYPLDLPNVVRHNIPDSYVDAVNPAHAAHFMWSTTLEFVPDAMFDDSRSISQHNCAVVVSGHRQLQGVNCLNQFFPLCQTTMK